MLRITRLKTEYQTLPMGIDTPRPRFSWIIESDCADTVQTAYRLVISRKGEMIWDSEKISGDCSVLAEYSGPPLETQTKYQVMAAIWDNHGQTAEAEGFFETGLMGSFKGNWISHGYGDAVEACPVFIKEFSLTNKVKSARLYASALGIYEAVLNGHKISDTFFAPGWTNYNKRIQYQTYDITALLRENNRLELTVANGWYSGIFGYNLKSGHYGKRTALWAQLEIIFDKSGSADARRLSIASDDSWQYGNGPSRYAEIYHGQIIDHNFPVSADGNAVIFNHPMNILTAQECEPVRITGRIKPVRFIITPKGEAVFDFGQNITGIIEARLNYPKNTTIKLMHAEILDKAGNFYTENLRNAKACDTFICSGAGEEVFLPAFTFHGFRYIKVEIKNASQSVAADSSLSECFTACVLHTDMEASGSFECSHHGVNRLQQNINWGQRGNFLDIPTDCPQRDERLGWTGDAQIFASTAAFNYNCALFFTKWLKDLKSEQTAQFGVPRIVPNILGDEPPAAAWSDAAAIVPWEMYQAYGDLRLLADQYDSMKGWVEYMRSQAGDTHLWQSGFQFADWLALDKEEGPGCTGATDIYLIATAFYAYSAGITAKAAQVLGYTNDAKQYSQLQQNICAAFRNEYITQTGRMASETQTACVLALHFGLANPEFRERILQSLISNLSRHNNHLTTGFVGTPYLCHVLSDNGCHELAAKLFLNEDYPSWLYEVKMGATTVWERWNSLRSDGSPGDAGMNSFNHYAYGSIGSWMYQKPGGLCIIEPGYKKSRIAPMPIPGITNVKASVNTVYGRLSCAWKLDNKLFSMDISVPCNTGAVVKLPGRDEEFSAGSGTWHYECEYC